MAPVAMVCFTIVENILQISLFMQNKPNFLRAQMNVNFYSQKDYDNKAAFRRGKIKPKQSQYIGNELKSPISPKLTKC